MANGDIVFELPPGGGNARNSEGAFASLGGGRIAFVYSAYHDSRLDDGYADLRLCCSHDNGRSWERDSRLLVPCEDHRTVMSVSLLRLPDRRLALFYLQKDEVDGGLVCMPKLRYSDDELETVGPAHSPMTALDYYVLNNDRVIQLRSGRLVMPVAMHRRLNTKGACPTDTMAPRSGAALIVFMLSDDAGETWYEARTQLWAQSMQGHGLQEPGVIELGDGRLWAYCRARAFDAAGSDGCQWQSFSHDQGITWSPAEPSPFRSPCSPLAAKHLPDGRLLAVWNDHSGHFRVPPAAANNPSDRRPLVAAVSSDNGQTWPQRLLLEDDPERGFCYVAIHILDDAVLLAYCAGGPAYNGVLNLLRIRRLPLTALAPISV